MQQSEVCEGGDFARYWQLDEKVGGDVKYSGSFFFFQMLKVRICW